MINIVNLLSKAGRFVALFAIYVIAAAAHANPRILIVSPEQTGMLQTGGLAHASTGLASGLNNLGVPADVLMPHYLQLKGPAPTATPEKISVALDWRGGRSHKQSQFTVTKLSRLLNPTILLRHDNPEGQKNYFDNLAGGYGPEPTMGESMGAFCKAAADYILSKNYDVVMLNDWTTGLIALHLYEAKLKGRKVPKVVFAIHNIAYQGNFPYSLAEFLGLDPRHFTMDGYEFYGHMSFLKAGMIYSDATYTVSRQYAKEISTPRFGAGLDGVVRLLQNHNRVHGFLNGITEWEWDPSRQVEGLPFQFSAADMTGKSLGKAQMQKDYGLTVEEKIPVFILTSRLAEQKGYEYLIEAVGKAAALGQSQWIITGDGDPKYIAQLQELERLYPANVRYRAFSPATEKFLTRYADFFVNGAWFEPSGLNQFFAMNNGTIPIGSAVGGLVDSIKRGKTGFLFDIVPGKNGEPYDREATVENAFKIFRRATTFFHHPIRVRNMRSAGMNESHSWESRVKADFLPFFETMLKGGPADCSVDLLP